MNEINGKFVFKKGENVALSENFNSNEFACPCSNPSCSQQLVSKKLIVLLEKIRKTFGSPIHINSGFRCAEHNSHVDGKPNSQHLTGEAADLAPMGQYADMLRLKKACDVNSKAMGVSPVFIHVDTRDDKFYRWTY